MLCTENYSKHQCFFNEATAPFFNILDEDDKGEEGTTWDVVCFTVETITQKRANENYWSVGTCSSNGKGSCGAHGGYFNYRNFTQQCCIPPGEHKITCNDCKGDTWHGGYLLINGVKYCENFTGKEHQVDITLDLPDGKARHISF